MDQRNVRATSFGSQAAVYDGARPSYPRVAVQWALKPLGASEQGRPPTYQSFPLSGSPQPSPAPRPSPVLPLSREPAATSALRGGSEPRAQIRIADIGAGTGKLTHLLQEFAEDLVAVDPDPAMLAHLRSEMPDVRTFEGKGESIPLPSGSLDAVFFGQSWHWTDSAAASIEVARVLKPGGVLALLWNVRDTSIPWVADYQRVLHGSDAEKMIENDAVRIEPPFALVERATFGWSLATTREALLALARSRSHFITSPASEQERIIHGCEELFDSIGVVEDSSIELPYTTHVFRALAP